MTDRPFLARYGGESLDQLLAMEDAYRIDSLVLAIEQALLARSELNDTERVVVSVEALEREVNNGGFDQFFFNAPEAAPHIVMSLRRIGCQETAAITQRAVDALSISGTITPQQIEDALSQDNEARDEILAECDKAYFKGVDEPIADKLYAFVKSNFAVISLSDANAP